MTTELLIEQMAETRALITVNTYMLQTILQSLGCDTEAMTDTVDDISMSLADRFESQMRIACGIEPRTEPRAAILPMIEELSQMKRAQGEVSKH